VKDLARKALAAKSVADELKGRADAAKAAALDAMDEIGAERLRVKADDNTDLGTLTLSPGNIAASVMDEAAFLKWVKANYPEAIVETVDAGWKARLLKLMKDADAPVDPNTGEAVPGVEMTQGEPFLTVRASAEAKDRARALLDGPALLELTGGETDA